MGQIRSRMAHKVSSQLTRYNVRLQGTSHPAAGLEGTPDKCATVSVHICMCSSNVNSNSDADSGGTVRPALILKNTTSSPSSCALNLVAHRQAPAPLDTVSSPGVPITPRANTHTPTFQHHRRHKARPAPQQGCPHANSHSPPPRHTYQCRESNTSQPQPPYA